MLAALAMASPASAQLSLPAATQAAAPGGVVRGVDGAYDPNNNVYLVVAGAGPLRGIFVNTAGQAVTAPFLIKGAGSSFPRAVFSPHANNGAGGFLVVWASEESKTVILRGRVISYTAPGYLTGTEKVLSGGATVWIDVGSIDLAYSPTSQRFLVAWKSMPPVKMYGAFVDNAATLISGPVAFTSTFGRDPGVAWNSTNNEFGVSFSGEISNAYTWSSFVRVPATNLAGFTRTEFNKLSFRALLTTATDVAFNPTTGRYVMGWFELGPSGPVSKVAELSAAGAVLTTGVATTHGSYDAFSVDYNPISKTLLLAALNRGNDTLVGAELNGHGYRFAVEKLISGSHPVVRYPRVAPNAEASQWLTTFSGANFTMVAAQAVSTTTANGGPAGAYGGTTAPPPTTPTTPPPPTGCTTVRPGANWTCVNGGWLPPGSGGTTTPPPTTPPPTTPPPATRCTTVRPGANWTCVNGGWLPPGAGGTTTPPPTTPPPTTPPPTTPPPATGCTSVRPGATWTCVNGGWLPPGMGGVVTPPTTPPPSGCSSPQPGASWTCVNGNWLPPGLGGCTSPQPGANWTCKNGGWLPPGHPSASLTPVSSDERLAFATPMPIFDRTAHASRGLRVYPAHDRANG